jgi:hypothetical protein
MLAELEELGMQLARATAARALADLAEPETWEAQEAAPQSEPLAAEPLPEAALAAAPRRAGGRPTGAGSTRGIDPVTSFIRLAKAVCELIALEAGLAAGPATKGGLVSPALRADPRREPLLQAFREVTEHKQDRSAARYEFARLLDEELTADPDQILGYPEIFYPICMSLGIELDVSKLSDQIIGMDPPPEDDPYQRQPPKPRATSPP